MNDDELWRRIHAADPARSSPSADSWVPKPLEATMRATREPQPPGRRRTQAVAAAAALAVVGAGVSTVLFEDDEPRDQTALTLAMPGSSGTAMGSCIPFDVNVLKDMPTAFSATVVEVKDGAVTLEVDHWYRGGHADLVVLDQHDSQTVSIDGIELVEGRRYLITATNGTVNFCGYSGRWSEDLASQFEQAF